ncbi:MAG: 2Fe-2S iron-sulfur cluster binding domain-containing protein, partial [Flavobacteriales bacterium]|nr:2Fe-2S iron-sulfur cluster binding domain-containing protein [Flavobacteriales bacterium]
MFAQSKVCRTAKKSIKVKNKTSLIKAAQKAGLHINASCGGAGVCGK